MRERQAVKLSGVSAETEQRGTVETITVAQQSDRGGLHTDEDEGRGGNYAAAHGPQTHRTHTHAHTGLINPGDEKQTDARPQDSY